MALFAIRPKIARFAIGPKMALFAIRPKIWLIFSKTLKKEMFKKKGL
jgi:hypothetical protein